MLCGLFASGVSFAGCLFGMMGDPFAAVYNDRYGPQDA